jgi:hypothetical protein
MTASRGARQRYIQSQAGDSAKVRVIERRGRFETVIKCRWCELPNPDGGTPVRVKFVGGGREALDAWREHCASGEHGGTENVSWRC